MFLFQEQDEDGDEDDDEGDFDPKVSLEKADVERATFLTFELFTIKQLQY